MSGTGRLYHSLVEKNPLKQNNAIRQLIDLSSERGGGGASITDFNAVADGVTDNTDALTKALASGVIDLYVPKGTFAVESFAFQIPSTMRRFGGPGTIQYTGAAPSPGSVLLYVDGTDFLEVWGLTLDVARNNNLNRVFVFAFLDDAGATANVRVTNVWFKNSGSAAILGTSLTNPGTGNLRIDHCEIENFGQSGIIFDTCPGDLIIDNNRVIGDGTALLHLVQTTTTGRTVIQDNFVYKNSNSGMGICVLDTGDGSLITGNVVLDGIWDGISLNAFTASVSHAAITNNVVGNPVISADEIGIGVNAYAGLSVADVSIRGNHVFRRGRAGVYVSTLGSSASISALDIAQNTIRNCNQNPIGTPAIDSAIVLTEATTAGSSIGAATSPNLVRNNSVTSSDAKTYYGVAEAVSAGTVDYTICMENYTNNVGAGQTLLVGTHSAEGMPKVNSAVSTITTTTYTLTAIDTSLTFNTTGPTALTLGAATAYTGRNVKVKTIAAQPIASATSNVCPISSATPGTVILSSSAGKWAQLESDGSNWVIMASN